MASRKPRRGEIAEFKRRIVTCPEGGDRWAARVDGVLLCECGKVMVEPTTEQVIKFMATIQLGITRRN